MEITIDDRITAALLNESAFLYYTTTPYEKLKTYDEKLIKQSLQEIKLGGDPVKWERVIKDVIEKIIKYSKEIDDIEDKIVKEKASNEQERKTRNDHILMKNRYTQWLNDAKKSLAKAEEGLEKFMKHAKKFNYSQDEIRIDPDAKKYQNEIESAKFRIEEAQKQIEYSEKMLAHFKNYPGMEQLRRKILGLSTILQRATTRYLTSTLRRKGLKFDTAEYDNAYDAESKKIENKYDIDGHRTMAKAHARTK